MNKVKKIVSKGIAKTTHFSSEIDSHEFVIRENDNRVFEANLDELPYCCGIIEIGDIGIYKQKIQNNADFQDAMDHAVNQLVADETSGKRCHTIMANLNNTAGCNALKDAFIRTGLFEPVKTFNNMTGGVITIWMSNN